MNRQPSLGSIGIYRDIYINYYIIFRKKFFREILVKLINLMEFELIWLDGWLNWPRGIIFRQDSEPKWLQIHQNLFENTRNHHPKTPENVKISENRLLLENGFVKSRPHMAALADPQSGKCSYIDPLFSIVSAKTHFRRSKKQLLPGVLISTPVSHKHTLFHLEPSGIYFL